MLKEIDEDIADEELEEIILEVNSHHFSKNDQPSLNLSTAVPYFQTEYHHDFIVCQQG